jgi:hypothetical protein
MLPLLIPVGLGLIGGYLLRDDAEIFADGGNIIHEQLSDEGFVDEYAKGGGVKGKKWIQEALSGGKKGALRKTAMKEGLLNNEDDTLSKSDLKKLQKMGGKTAKRAHLAETLKNFD